MDNGLSGYAVSQKVNSAQIRRQWHTRAARLAATVALLLGSWGSGALVAYAAPLLGTVLAKDQVLVRNNGAEVASLDPHKIEGVPESNVSRDLLEGLVITDPNGKMVPGVAERWENQGFRVWTFHLRKDARWSNGDPVTAQDFVYSWQRLADPATASPYASYLQYGHIVNIDDIIAGKKMPDTLGVKAVDDHTLEVTLSEAVPYFDKLPVYPAMSPINRAAVEQFGEKWTQPQHWVGNGAYTLKSWVVNERLVLVRNPHYWDNAHTTIGQVTYLPISSEVTDVNRYRSGEIDITYTNLPIELFQKMKQEIPDEVKVTPYLCSYYYEMNNQRAPFTDVRVRQALRLGLDQTILTNKVKNQGDMPAYGFVPPYIDGLKASVPEWFTWSQEKRNAEAKRLLTEAGYTPEKPLTLTLLYNTSDLHKKMAIAAASLWKQNIGVNVKLENQEWKTFLSTRHQGNYDLARAGWCADYNEPSSFLNSMLSDSSSNTSHYKSAAFDALIAKSMQVANEEERATVYQQAETQLDRDAVTIPVFYYANTRLVKPYVGGLTGKDPLDNIHVKDLYILQH